MLPLPPPLVAVLAAVPQAKRSGFLFPGRWQDDGSRARVTSKRKAITSACTAAGVDPAGVSHHSFRYAFTTLLEELGAPRGVVRALARHDPDAGEITDRYVDPTPEQLRLAIDTFAAKVLGPPVAVPMRRPL